LRSKNDDNYETNYLQYLFTYSRAKYIDYFKEGEYLIKLLLRRKSIIKLKHNWETRNGQYEKMKGAKG
jgi:hypothetical protein